MEDMVLGNYQMVKFSLQCVLGHFPLMDPSHFWDMLELARHYVVEQQAKKNSLRYCSNLQTGTL